MQHRVVETFCVESFSFISKRSTINHNGFQCTCIFSTFSICWTGTQPDDMRKSVNKREPVFFEKYIFFLSFFSKFASSFDMKCTCSNISGEFFFSKLFLHSLWTLVWYETLCIHGSYINESVNFRVNNSRRKWCSQQETLIPFPNYRMMKTFTDRAIWRYVLIIYTYWYL